MPSTPRSDPTVKITVRPVCPDDWPIIERLFGANGACGGCWCMWARLPQGGKLWEEKKGPPNKRAFKRLLTSGRIYGCLAFAGEEAVGWCCVGPRADFPRLERVRALRTHWNNRTWSVTCFYIPARWRRRGVASALLRGAVQVARDNGACELQGYPIRSRKKEVPPVFAWTGVPALFDKQRFQNVTPRGNPREIYLRRFRK